MDINPVQVGQAQGVAATEHPEIATTALPSAPEPPPVTDRAGNQDSAQPPLDPADNEIVGTLVEQINQRLHSFEPELHQVNLVYDENDPNPVIEIRSAESDEVIITIPPKAIVDMRKNIREVLGMMLDRRL